jgi:hypothetical protein
MGQQQTKEEPTNYQNYKPNQPIQTNQIKPVIPQNQPNQNINQGYQYGNISSQNQNSRPQYVVDQNKPRYKGGIVLIK